MKLGKKNGRKTPRTADTARYKRRQIEQQKKAEKSFINILKNSDLKKIKINAFLQLGMETFKKATAALKSGVVSLKKVPNTLGRGGKHFGKEMHAIAKEMGLLLSKKNRESVAFGTILVLIIFVSYSAVSTVFPNKPMGEEDTWLAEDNSIEAQLPQTSEGPQLIDNLMAGPKEFAGLSDIKTVIATNLMEKQNALMEEMRKANELAKMVNPVPGCQLIVDKKLVAILGTKQEAETLLEQIKSGYIKKDDPSATFIGYVEKVELIEKQVEKSSVMTIEEANKMLMYGGQEVKTHIVESGESVWLIARENNMRVKDLEIANPGKNLELVHIGDELKLVSIKPLISIKSHETLTLNEQIPFVQKVEQSKALYKDQSKIKVKGAAGQRVITADVVKVNGQITEKKVLTEKIIRQPKTQYLVKGTKEIPSSFGSLAFRMPLYGKINTYFGSRGYLWGRERHRGIDIDGTTGETVISADGGKVQKTGYDGRSGNYIEINHGRGYVTFYAHLSKIAVRTGQNVAKGQYIGKVGNTGHSTGSHLHFEIRINNTPVNPFKYLR